MSITEAEGRRGEEVALILPFWLPEKAHKQRGESAGNWRWVHALKFKAKGA